MALYHLFINTPNFLIKLSCLLSVAKRVYDGDGDDVAQEMPGAGVTMVRMEGGDHPGVTPRRVITHTRTGLN